MYAVSHLLLLACPLEAKTGGVLWRGSREGEREREREREGGREGERERGIQFQLC